MLPKGPAKKVTIYVNEDTRHGMEPLWSAVFGYLLHNHVAGATVTRPTMGFGGRQRPHDARSEYSVGQLPVRVEFVDIAQKVDELLPTLYEMVQDGLIEVQDTTIIKSIEKGKNAPPREPRTSLKGPAKIIRIYLGEADQWQEEPLYKAVLKRFLMMDIAGATVYRGILGYGAKGHTHKDGFMHLSQDAPIMISVVDTPERITEAIAAIEPMMQDALIVISDVEMIRLLRRSRAEEPSNADPPAR